MAKARFEYQGDKRKTEDVVRRAQQAGRGYDSFINSDIPTWKVKEGENICRILPNTWSKEENKIWGDMWDIRVYLHYGVGPDNASYLCLDKMKGEPCPVCDARRESADVEEQDKLRPSERRLAWIVDRNNEKAGPQVWSMPATVYKDLVKRTVDNRSGDLCPVDSPEEGFDIFFTREGTDLRTKYTGVDVDRSSTPLHDNEKQQDRWLAYVVENPLPDVLQYYDYDYIEGVLFGKRKAEEEETEVAPKSRRRGREEAEPEETTTRFRRGRNDDGEVEEEVARHGPAEDDGDAPPPRRTGARPRAEAEETDDSDVPPRRGRGREPEEAEEVVETRPSRTRSGGRRGGNGAEAEEEVQEEETVSTRRRGAAEPPPRGRLGGLRERRASR